MYIIFGTYSKKIKTISHSELGISENYKDIEFQLYQKIAYAYFIPIVPLGKHWKIKHTITKQEISVPDDVHKKLIRANDKIKSPFWSYIGSIVVGFPVVLGIAFLVFSLFSNLFSEIANSAKKGIESVEKRNEHDKKNEGTIKFIENPIIGDTYEFKVIEMIIKKNSNGKKLGFKKGDREHCKYKVIEIENKTITLQIIDFPVYSKIDIILKDIVKLTFDELTSISNTYKNLPLYDGIKNSMDENVAEAVFAIDRIIRKN